VIVKAKPDADFSFSHSGCTKDTILFKGKDTTSNSYVVRDFKWTFPGGQQSDSFSVKRLYAPGSYDIKLSVVTRDGCASDTTKSITIGDKPPAGFTTLPEAVCEGSVFQFKDTSSPGISVSRWYWSFGDGKDSVSSAGPTMQYVYPSAGVYKVRHASSSSPTCVSDTLEKQVTVYALPAVTFSNDANGCLPPSGVVRFTGTASSPDGQAISAYAWQFGDANATAANPNTSNIKDPTHNFQAGTYAVKFSATTVNGCSNLTTVASFFKLKPALAFAPLTDICQNVATLSVAKGSVTNGLPGSFVYRGPGTSADGKFDPKVAGPGTHTIWYEYTTNDGCSDSISQTIKVSATPVASFNIPNSGCLPVNGRVLFNNTSTIADGQTLSYLWNFGDANAGGSNPNTSTLRDPSHDYAEGTYNIKLSVTSADGCSKDTSISATFALKPVINFAGLTAVCQESSVVDVAKALVTNGVTGTGIYRGPGTTAAGSFSPAAAGAGTHTIWFVYTTAGGCIDSVSQTIKVHATPSVSFSVAGGACLPPNGRVQFLNTTTVADLQALTYLWNFGDANAGGANPNSSTLKDPSHDYKEGTFSIKLTTSTANGCMKDTTMSMTFALKPILAFAALTPICQDAAAITINQGTATNGVTGTGIYRGPGTSDNGRFDPLVSGHGTHTIWYVFTTTGGCTDSVSGTIVVYPRPNAAFTATADVCLGKAVTITDGSTIASGTIASWQWDLKDGNQPLRVSGSPFTHTYNTSGTYKISLVAQSAFGCKSIPKESDVLVSPNPVATFTLPASVCFPGNPVVMTNTSTVADNSALSHTWDYGDGSALGTTVNGSRIYAATGSYSIKLTTVSAKGCSDETTKVFNAFFGKPVARFTMSAADICQGVESQFSDASTDVGSSITARNWSFGDGSSSALADPKKRYNSPGRYTVTLTATNAAGCVSDPFSQQVNVFLQPVVDAGPSFVVPQGSVVTFLSIANDPGLVFLWTPTPDLTPASQLRASVTALQDQVYRLTATGQNGCTAADTVSVKILKTVRIPNVFSPNGDGVNDRWNIENMADYPGCTLQVFNRYGQLVYTVAGYNTPWDGKVSGKDLPVGVYYYIINLKNGFKPINGSITIIR
jgi:gliding motility-associated-like protein